MEQIAQYWIQDTIKPSGSPQCGNHVAARWYSSGSARFLDFTPPLATYYEEYSLVFKFITDFLEKYLLSCHSV